MHFPLPTYCSCTATKAKCSQCSQHKLEHTTSMHSVCALHTPEKQKHCTSTLPPHVVFLHCNSPPWLVHYYFSARVCGSNVESASMLVSLLVCAGPGRKGSRYSDICAGAICTIQHTDTHGLTTCVCTHTRRYLYKHIATCITHTAQQHAHKTETHGRTNNKKPESSHKQPQCLNTPRNSYSQHPQPANNTKKPENHTV